MARRPLPVDAAELGLEALQAVHLALLPHRFGGAIGIQQDRVLTTQRRNHGANLVGRLVHDAERRSCSLQLLEAAVVRAIDDPGRVAGRGIAQLAGAQVEIAQEKRHERARRHVTHERPVHLREYRADVIDPRQKRPQQRSRRDHEQGRADAVPGDIADHDRDAVRAEVDVVEVVAAGLLARTVESGDFEPAAVHRSARQHRLLQLLGLGQLGGHATLFPLHLAESRTLEQGAALGRQRLDQFEILAAEPLGGKAAVGVQDTQDAAVGAQRRADRLTQAKIHHGSAISRPPEKLSAVLGIEHRFGATALDHAVHDGGRVPGVVREHLAAAPTGNARLQLALRIDEDHQAAIGTDQAERLVDQRAQRKIDVLVARCGANGAVQDGHLACGPRPGTDTGQKLAQTERLSDEVVRPETQPLRPGRSRHCARTSG